MAKVKAGPINADRLKSFVERIERLEEERKAIGGDIRDIYSEAKGVGYDVKAMRKIVQLRAMDSADRAEQETILDTYKHALDMGDDGLEEQANARALKRFSEIDRCMRLSNNGEPPRIDAIMRELKCSSGKASAIRKLCEDRLASVSFSSPSDEDEIETSLHTADGVIIETEKRGTEAPRGEDGTHALADVAGSLPASTGPELASGPSCAAADCRVSPEPAGVTPLVNADPLAGRASPTDECGQGPEVGTFLPEGPCGQAHSEAAGSKSCEAGPETGPLEVDHGARQLTPPGLARYCEHQSCGDGDGPVSVDTQPRAPGSDGRAAPPIPTGEGAGHHPGPHDTNPAPLSFEPIAAAGAAVVPTRKDGRSGERDTDIDLAVPPFLDRRQKREAA